MGKITCFMMGPILMFRSKLQVNHWSMIIGDKGIDITRKGLEDLGEYIKEELAAVPKEQPGATVPPGQEPGLDNIEAPK